MHNYDLETTDPVEKFSPPSDTGDSRLRKTFAFSVSSFSSAVSDGIRCTRRSASYWDIRQWWFGSIKRRHTISESWYSSKTSKVDRRVPERIVGSSAKTIERLKDTQVMVYSRGIIVNFDRRSVRPIFEISKSSTRIRPSVGSTNLKNDKARVDFPLPVLPRIPTWELGLVEWWRQCKTQSRTFSPGRISKLRWCKTLGKSG